MCVFNKFFFFKACTEWQFFGQLPDSVEALPFPHVPAIPRASLLSWRPVSYTEEDCIKPSLFTLFPLDLKHIL